MKYNFVLRSRVLTIWMFVHTQTHTVRKPLVNSPQSAIFGTVWLVVFDHFDNLIFFLNTFNQQMYLTTLTYVWCTCKRVYSRVYIMCTWSHHQIPSNNYTLELKKKLLLFSLVHFCPSAASNSNQHTSDDGAKLTWFRSYPGSSSETRRINLNN